MTRIRFSGLDYVGFFCLFNSVTVSAFIVFIVCDATASLSVMKQLLTPPVIFRTFFSSGFGVLLGHRVNTT